MIAAVADTEVIRAITPEWLEKRSGELNLSDYIVADTNISEDAIRWLMEHCTDYGFVFRYPAEKAPWYGVPCSHAHFRYVGVEAAKFMTEHDLCLEEFLSLYDPDLVYVPDHGRFA